MAVPTMTVADLDFATKLEDEIEAEVGNIVTFNHEGRPVTGMVTEVGIHYWSYMVIILHPQHLGTEMSIPSYRVLQVNDWVGDLCQI